MDDCQDKEKMSFEEALVGLLNRLSTDFSTDIGEEITTWVRPFVNGCLDADRTLREAAACRGHVLSRA